MDPIVGAAAISAGANLAGGLLGGLSSAHESRKNRAEARRQFNVQDDYNKNLTQYRVADALKAGIHPLAALGQSANYSPTIHAGDNSGAGDIMSNAISRAGDNLSRIFTEQDVESRELDLESKRLQNQLIKQKIAEVQQPGFISPSGGNNTKTPSIQDLFVPFRTKDGKIVYRLNQDAVPDTDVTNVSTWQTIGDDPGAIASWFRDVIMPRNAPTWQQRYLPGYDWLMKTTRGFIR